MHKRPVDFPSGLLFKQRSGVVYFDATLVTYLL